MIPSEVIWSSVIGIASSEDIGSYVIGIASSVTIILIYKVYVYLTSIYPLRKLWDEYVTKESYGILSSSGSLVDIDTISTGVYDTLALADIKELLSSFPKTIFRPYVSTNFPPNLNENNIILFGGPISNEITKRIMVDKEETFLKFRDHTLVNTKNNKTFEPEVRGNKVTKDYGIVIKMNSIFNPNLKLIIIAGCYDYGTYLASRALIEPNIIKKVMRIVGKNDFEIVVSGEIIEGVPQTPIIELDGIIIKGEDK